MILHLERKFAELTETFIINQLKTIKKYQNLVFAIDSSRNDLDATILKPGTEASKWDYKILSKTNKKYFINQGTNACIKLIHSHFLTDARFFNPFSKNLSVPKICSCYGYDVSRFPRQ